jgi:hypothetical protein
MTIQAIPFNLRVVLMKSGKILSSSDLGRVKVTRIDPATKEKREFILDVRNDPKEPADQLWIRAGDKIDVPEKSG